MSVISESKSNSASRAKLLNLFHFPHIELKFFITWKWKVVWQLLGGEAEFNKNNKERESPWGSFSFHNAVFDIVTTHHNYPFLYKYAEKLKPMERPCTVLPVDKAERQILTFFSLAQVFKRNLIDLIPHAVKSTFSSPVQHDWRHYKWNHALMVFVCWRSSLAYSK